MAERLTGALDEQADHVPFARDLAGLAKGLAIAFATANGKGARPGEDVAHERHRQKLDFRHVVDRSRTERAKTSPELRGVARTARGSQDPRARASESRAS